MEKIITSAAGGATTAVLAWIARYHDPLYSDGWLLNNPQWLYIPVIVVVAAVIMSLWTSGLVTLFLLTLVAASIFAWLYGRSDQSEPWPVITWILHLVDFCNDRRDRRSRKACLCLVAWSATGPGRHTAIESVG